MATVPTVRWRAGWVAGHAGVLATTVAAVSPGLGRVFDDRALHEVASNGWYTCALTLPGQDAP